ncbi:MAG: amidohydrolase, partial [Mesorhizobium sp.]
MPQTADLIVENASILTMDPDTPAAQAIAIKGDKIIAIADRDSVRDCKGPATRVVDAQGGSVLPGFIEAHMHLFGGAAELDNLHLTGVQGFDALRDAIQGFAAKRPKARLLLGAGVDYAILPEPVTRHHLDRIIPDRPFA